MKIALETTKISYVLHAEQMHNKFMLCFSSSLILVESYSFLTLFQKTLSLKFNEFIPLFLGVYVWNWDGSSLFQLIWDFFSFYVFHIKLGLIYF